MNVIISKHAKERINTYNLTEKIVVESIKNPDEIVKGYAGMLIAHKLINEYLLRIVYSKDNGKLKVITVYPAKKERYFKKQRGT